MTHVEGEVDPVRDFDIIAEELRLKDEEALDKTLEKMERTVIRANDKKLKPEYVRLIYCKLQSHLDTFLMYFSRWFQDTLVKVKQIISEEKKHIRFADWSAHDVSAIISL